MNNKPKLTIDDCTGIAQLLDHGFTFQEAMTILENKHNEPIFQTLKHQQEEGIPLTNELLSFIPKSISATFSCFIQIMPFADAIAASMETYEEETALKKKVLQQLIYPSLLLIGTMIGVLLFNAVVMPMMISLLNGIVEVTGYEKAQQVVSIGLSVFMISLMVCGFLGVLLTDEKHIVKTYYFLLRHHPHSLLIQHCSLEFAIFFLACIKRNIATKDTLNVLKKMPHRPFIQDLAHTMDEQLTNGDKFITSIHKQVDLKLVQFFRIAGYTSDIEQQVKAYITITKEKRIQQIMRLSKQMQLVSYILIGLLLLYVYQILSAPMAMLNNI